MKKIIYGLLCALLVFACTAGLAQAQTTGGTIRGTVTDQQGLAVADAKVTITNEQTNVAIPLTTASSGLYSYPDLGVGAYSVTVEKDGFQKLVRPRVQVFADQVTEVSVALTVGTVSTTLEITSGAPLVQTTTSQISNDFNTLEVTDLPNTALDGSPLNLALLAPGTTGQAAGVAGEGGSVGGQRPRMNSFTIDGVDDNRQDVNGHSQNVIQDSVAEFNLLTNQFSAEYGHSAAGQFNIITKTGTNNWHGDGWEYNQNRHYNARTNIDKGAGLTQPARFDYNRFGGDVGGPIVHNKLFIYGAVQRIVEGLSTQAVEQSAPTAAGLATLQSLADPAIKAILAQFPTASSADTSLPVHNVLVAGTAITSGGKSCAVAPGCPIPFGDIFPLAPNYYNQTDFLVNGDVTLGKHQDSFHVLYDRNRQPNVNPDTPQDKFTGAIANDARKYLFKDTWILSDRLVNDFRAAYSRFLLAYTVPAAFAGYPNAEVDTDGLDVGPQGCSPQSIIINTYQISDSMSYVVKTHTLKWGAVWTDWISPNGDLPRSRGEWDYANINELANDYVPTGFNGALRNVGFSTFLGNSNGIGLYVQDDWKITSRLTANLGIRYEWQGVPQSENQQNLNSISNLPGVFNFNTPAADWNNWGPRIGFAYDPFGNGKWAVRGAFGISYDVTPLNFSINSLPPELQIEQNPDITCGTPGAPAWCADYVGGTGLGKGFLQGGGLLTFFVPCTTQAACRLSTGSIMLPIVDPKVLTWSLGVQHELGWNSSLEVRYVGTRGLDLPIQARLNVQTGFDAGLAALPTYLTTSAIPATVASPAATLATWNTFNSNAGTCAGVSRNIYGAQGFCGSLVTGFPPKGASIYHGVSADFNHRLGHGLTLRANYTFSKAEDNSTNEFNTSRVNPRRAEDWSHLVKGLSALDVPQKLVLTWVYQIPGAPSDSRFVKGFTGGWQVTGSWLATKGTPVTILNNADANGDGDSAGDRPILNSAGTIFNGVSGVNQVCNDGAAGATRIVTSASPACATNHVVGYVIQNTADRYVVAKLGTRSTVGLNTFRSPGINTWDMSIGKETNLTERFHLQFRLDIYDVWNHRSPALAQPSVFEPQVNNALSATYTNIASVGNGFLDSSQFDGGSRNMQLMMKLKF